MHDDLAGSQAALVFGLEGISTYSSVIQAIAAALVVFIVGAYWVPVRQLLSSSFVKLANF